MDVARYAAQSDPDCNRHFRRRWTEEEIPSWHLPEQTPTTLEDISMQTLIAWRREAPGRDT
ncbi:hypothetical protein IBL26_11830 [Roseomonas aerophila]|uniref:Uncharacterized protein n=1 Tax=Teichococcus aerophilus TaxID=1224513 RepID=A0ABR7RLS1_9PROT|nr:hypothetical protein [Pseudoroseomonas aerophila]MBC9207525.1 hypothetical protein [Pseudoroseomonas aerophila]